MSGVIPRPPLRDTVAPRQRIAAILRSSPSVKERRMGQTVELMERITVNPDQCGRRPCIRGLRIRVIDVLDLLATGLRFASRRLDH